MVRLPASLDAELVEAARAEGLSVNGAVTRAVAGWLDARDRAAEAEAEAKWLADERALNAKRAPKPGLHVNYREGGPA